MKTYVFFRDDEVSTLDDSFLKLHNFMKERNMPISYAVIPGKLDTKMAGFLLSSEEDITIMQHGFNHKSALPGQDSELGGLNFEEQREIIRKGMISMERAFGSKFTKVFVPPFHHWTDVTLAAIKPLGFDGVSLSCQTRLPDYLFSLPVHIQIHLPGSGGAVHFEELCENFSNLRKEKSIIGIYMHHKDLGSEGWENTGRFFEYLVSLKEKGEIKFFSARKVIEKRKCKNISSIH